VKHHVRLHLPDRDQLPLRIDEFPTGNNVFWDMIHDDKLLTF